MQNYTDLFGIRLRSIAPRVGRWTLLLITFSLCVFGAVLLASYHGASGTELLTLVFVAPFVAPLEWLSLYPILLMLSIAIGLGLRSHLPHWGAPCSLLGVLWLMIAWSELSSVSQDWTALIELVSLALCAGVLLMMLPVALSAPALPYLQPITLFSVILAWLLVPSSQKLQAVVRLLPELSPMAHNFILLAALFAAIAFELLWWQMRVGRRLELRRSHIPLAQFAGISFGFTLVVVSVIAGSFVGATAAVLLITQPTIDVALIGTWVLLIVWVTQGHSWAVIVGTALAAFLSVGLNFLQAAWGLHPNTQIIVLCLFALLYAALQGMAKIQLEHRA